MISSFLLALQSTKLRVTENEDAFPADAVLVIYDFISSRSMDISDRIELLQCLSALLAMKRYQRGTLIRREMELIAALLVFSYTHSIATLKNPFLDCIAPLKHDVQKPENERALEKLREEFAAILTSMSEQRKFTVKYHPESDFVKLLVSWLPIPQPTLQVCACRILCNLTTSSDISTSLSSTQQLDIALLDIMREKHTPLVVGEALRSYSYLAYFPENKRELASNAAFDIITRLFSEPVGSDVRYYAIFTLRVLLIGQYQNVKDFLELRPDRRSSDKWDNIYIGRVLFLYQSTDDIRIQMEVARTVVEIWRVASRHPPGEGPSRLRLTDTIERAGNAHLNIAQPVMMMIQDSHNSALITEGWYAFALMTQSPVGCDVVYDALDEGEGMSHLKYTVMSLGPGTPDQYNALHSLEAMMRNYVSSGMASLMMVF